MDIRMLLKAIPFEFERSVCSRLNRLLKRRPTSVPFLSGDTFRAFADGVYDETNTPGFSEIKKGSILFIKTDFLEDFQAKILPKLQDKIIIITSNSDYVISKDHLPILENPCIEHWFGVNTIITHKKLTTIPLGLENVQNHNNGICADYRKLQKKIPSISKDAKIVMAFTLGTNPHKRFACYEKLYNFPFTQQFSSLTTAKSYRTKLAKYMFVASPSGNGPDCHRTWEAIYIGVVPIVEKNTMNNYFISLDLPIWGIDSWDEVANCTQEELRVIYHKIISHSTTVPAYFEYWKEQILMVKNTILTEYDYEN